MVFVLIIGGYLEKRKNCKKEKGYKKTKNCAVNILNGVFCEKEESDRE